MYTDDVSDQGASGQDLHSGTVTPPQNSSWGLHFAGHLTLSAIVDELIAKHGLSDAEQAVLSGDSAGGIGTWINVDWLQARLSRAKVVAAPIAGFYAFAYPYTGPGHTSSGLADFREPAWDSHVALWGSHLPSACAAALGKADESWCMLSNYSAPYVSAPVFVIEAQTDCVQLTAHDWVPSKARHAKADTPVGEYMVTWKDNQTVGLKATLKPGDGWFNPACFIHTEFTHTAPLIGGRSYVQAFDTWYNNRTAVRLEDSCGLLCNEHCSINWYC